MFRSLWFPLWMLCGCAAATVWMSAQEVGEIDPFGAEKEVPKAAAPAPEKKKKDEPAKVETDSIVVGILASNPQTNEQLIQAIINLMNYGRADAAKGYGTTFLANKPDDQASWKLQRKFGSAEFFRLSVHPDLQPEGEQLADAVLDGANRYVREPARLAALVQQLHHERPEMRSAAVVDLAEAGADAVVAVVQGLNDPSREQEHAYLRAALVRLGKVSVGPLLAAIESPDEGLRQQAIITLGELQSREAIPFLLRSHFTAGQPGEKEAARQALARILKDVPTQEQAESYLFRLVREYLNGRLPGVPNRDHQLELWRWDPAQQRPVPQRFDLAVAPVAYAAWLGDILTDLDPSDSQYRLWHLVAVLDTAKMTGGWNQPLARGPGTAFALAVDHRDMWDQALQFALERNHIPAAVALLEVIGETGDASWVQSAGRDPREIVKALRHPSRRVQFAALQAILRTSPREPFAGASYVPEALGYFVRVTGDRRILIAHPRVEQAQTLAGIYREFGIESKLVSRGPDALQAVLENADIEFALLSDGLDHPNVQEQVAQIRRVPRLRRFSIGVLARPENLERLQRAFAEDSWTQVFPYPLDAAGASWVMRQLMDRVERDWVSQDERMQQAAAALDMLTALVQHPAVFSFYELLPQEPAVELALTVPGLSSQAARVLGLFASPQSQRTLIALVNQTGRPLTDRQAAAQAFDQAVKSRGLLLTGAEILKQYDLYNASKGSDAGTQQVLGAVLDTIENAADATE